MRICVREKYENYESFLSAISAADELITYNEYFEFMSKFSS